MTVLQRQAMADLEGAHSTLNNSQNRLEVASQRLEDTQARMEHQLQGILAHQHRNESPILSQSLDASSPEGRDTWMNLGRLLRAEGISTQAVKQNRDILIKAIKNTLKGTPSSSIPESFHTASESLFDDRSSYPNITIPTTGAAGQSPGMDSIDILGSAPPRGATFTEEFLARQNEVPEILDRQEKLDSGMHSLLEGMGDIEIEAKTEEENEDYTIDVNELNDKGELEPHASVKHKSFRYDWVLGTVD